MWDVLFILHEVNQDVVTLTIGNDDTDACLLHLRGSGILGVHATTAKGTLLRLDIFREVATWITEPAFQPASSVQ